MVEFKVELNDEYDDTIDINLFFKKDINKEEDLISIDHKFLLKLQKKYNNLMRRYYNGDISYPILTVRKDFVEIDKKSKNVNDELLRVCKQKDYDEFLLKDFTYEVVNYNNFNMTISEFMNFIVDFLGYKHENCDKEFISNLEFLDISLFSSFKRVLKLHYDINNGLLQEQTYPTLKFIYKKYGELNNLNDVSMNKELFLKITEYLNSVSGVYLEVYDGENLLEEKYVDFERYNYSKINLEMKDDNLLIKKDSFLNFILELTEGYNFDNVVSEISYRNGLISNTLYNYSYVFKNDRISNFIENNENCMLKFFLVVLGVWFYLLYVKILFLL
jgi:hypothetical protein